MVSRAGRMTTRFGYVLGFLQVNNAFVNHMHFPLKFKGQQICRGLQNFVADSDGAM